MRAADDGGEAVAAEALRRGEGRVAQAAAHRALALTPDSPVAWNIVGTLAIGAGDLPRALAAFGRAGALDDGPRSAVNRAMALERAERWGESLAAYAAVLRRFPGHSKAAERHAVVS
ncbi:MAG TPA: tetratricopeptide repeat protein, partial [Azospirillum sp.]